MCVCLCFGATRIRGSLPDMRIVAGTAGMPEEPDKLFVTQMSLLPHFGLTRGEAKWMRLSPWYLLMYVSSI